jgi:tetratricopeptide (TPR) repeat protein
MSLNITIRFTTIVLISILFVSAASRSARELNTEGYRLYQQKRYAEAMELFRKATEADSKYALAHYNLACTLAILRTVEGPCEHNAYRRTIIHHLREAVQLDPRRKSRLKSDPDLKPVHDTFGYQILLGLSLKNSSDVQTILTRVSWYGPSPGVYGPISGVRFKSNGKVALWVLDENARKKEYTGKYTVMGSRISIQLDQSLAGVRKFEGVLKENGVLDLPGLRGPFTDEPDECGA